MQVNQENINKLCLLLQNTQSPDSATRKQAEEQIKKIETQRGYIILLAQIIPNKQINESLRLVAAVMFRQFIQKQWNPNVKDSLLSNEERDQIRKNIVNMMLSTSGKHREQLSEVVSIIASHDFFKNWPTLIQELVSHFQSKDFGKIHGILYTAHSIFKRYRDRELTEDLVDEVNYVLKGFAQPMLSLFKGICGMVPQFKDKEVELKTLFKCLVLLIEIFYSLNWLDLPEFFEDHMKEYMQLFHFLLTFESKVLETPEDSDEPGLLLEAKAMICECLNLYMEKYGEEFGPYVETFAKAIWGLLMKTGMAMKYDTLVSKAIYFITIVSTSEKHVLFKDENTLKSICQQIIIPNLSLRDSDVEMFEDDPVEYIRRDIEGSDSDTRRRSAVELVKGLCMYYEDKVTPIMVAKAGELLKAYESNPRQNWKAKDIAMYIINAVGSRAKTGRKGITQVNPNAKVMEFYANVVLPELKDASSHSPILKADAIKFVTMFRYHLPKESFSVLFPLLIQYLKSPARVVHTYAAWAIERFLTITEENKVHRYGKNEVKPYAKDLLTNLFGALQHKESSENEYVMKAIMRVTTVLKEDMAPFLQIYIQSLTNILARVCKNPRNPSFNHYIFESYATVVKFNPKSVEAFEKALLPPFQTILQSGIEEFTPYVFQIMSQMLELRPVPLPQHYLNMFPNFLNASLWENTGNIPGLVGLIGTFIKKAPNEILKGKNLEGVLGIFRKLVFSRTLDHEGFFILNSLVGNLQPNQFGQYFKPILSVLFNRLHKNKTGKFVKCLIIFFSFFIVKHGCQLLLEAIEGIQSGLFKQITPFWHEYTQKVKGVQERKLCAVALVKLLCETPAFFQDRFFDMWGPFVLTLMKLLELPEDTTVDSQDYVGFDTTPVGYKVEFTVLAHAKQKLEDPVKDIPSPKTYFAQKLNALLQQSGLRQKLVPAIKQSLPQEALQKLASYFVAANLNPNILA